MRRVVCLIACLAWAVPAFAQEVPPLIVPPMPYEGTLTQESEHRVLDGWLAGAIGGSTLLHILDLSYTNFALGTGRASEKSPIFKTAGIAVMTVGKMIVVAATGYVAWRWGRKWAPLFTAIGMTVEASLVGYVVMHNARIVRQLAR